MWTLFPLKRVGDGIHGIFVENRDIALYIAPVESGELLASVVSKN